MNDETLIRAALAAWHAAFCRKDADAVCALYAPDAVLFDAIPPFSDGPGGLRAKLTGCFPYFPDGFAIETRDLAVHVGGALAAAHCLWRFTGLPPGHPAGRHWLRSSTLFRQHAGRWLIVHDHCSAPFNPYTEKAVLTLDVDAGLAPAGCGDPGGANPVGWFELYVADMDRAKAFYAAVFGFEFTRLESPIDLWAFPMHPGGHGISGALARIDGLDPGGSSVLVYFTCADCAVQAGRAASHGGTVVKPKFSIGQSGHIAHLRDSEGNMIGLHSPA